MTDIAIECPLTSIPDTLEPPIAHLHVGTSLHIRDIEYPEGVTPLHGADEVVLTVKAKRGTIEVETTKKRRKPRRVHRAGGHRPREGGRRG